MKIATKWKESAYYELCGSKKELWLWLYAAAHAGRGGGPGAIWPNGGRIPGGGVQLL